ncbi:hypothetical protein EK21DRAFT_79743 [Setomelanomma holmii]|uniref:Uncharacterized protein n=1 Tax=Setomelanomma holmii TaxID=210430 RepID=A0A9P4LHA1_9PLEO|nr:hypothetical protein EK21DRAFT_79743 [Setomelanomma holmii]
MPRSPPQNLVRAFKTRYNGIFEKASELHEIDDSVRITVIIEKPGSVPLVFTTEETGMNWPPHMQGYVNHRRPIVKRPSHYQSLSDGISTGRARIIRSTSGSSSPPPQLDSRGQTPQSMEVTGSGEEYHEGGLSHRSREAYVPVTPSRKLPVRTSSPLPIPFVLPSKMCVDDWEG